MGSWNEVCALSRCSIHCGDRAVFLILKKSDAESSMQYAAACPPVRGVYDDYGQLKFDKDDPIAPMLERFFGCDMDTIQNQFARGEYDGPNEEYPKLKMIDELELSYCFILEEVYEYLSQVRGSLFDRHDIGDDAFLEEMGFVFDRESPTQARYKRVYKYPDTDVEVYSDNTFLQTKANDADNRYGNSIHSFEDMFRLFPILQDKIDISKLSKDKFELAIKNEDWGDIMKHIDRFHKTLSRPEMFWFHFPKEKVRPRWVDVSDDSYIKRIDVLGMLDRFDNNPIPEIDEKVAEVKAIYNSKEKDYWTKFCTAQRELEEKYRDDAEKHNYFHYKMHCNALWMRVYYEMLQNRNMNVAKEMFNLSRLYRQLWHINMPLMPLVGRVGSQFGEEEDHNEFLKLVMSINQRVINRNKEDE